MSSQKMLNFGRPLAPSIIIRGSADPRLHLARVHSLDEPIPGEGRHIVTCQRCGRTRRRRRASRFCSDGCRFAHRHDERARIEAGKKRRAMRGSAALNAGYLRIAREAAHRIRKRDGTADADRVRFLLESEGTLLPWGGWSGSLFPADPDYSWTPTGERPKCKHKGSKNREIKEWR